MANHFVEIKGPTGQRGVTDVKKTQFFGKRLSTVTLPEGFFSIVLYENGPISTPPNQTSIQPSQTLNAGNLKKTRAKGQRGPRVVQTQEIPTFSDKCCSCIKHVTPTTVFRASSCMTTGKHKDKQIGFHEARNSVWHLHGKTRRALMASDRWTNTSQLIETQTTFQMFWEVEQICHLLMSEYIGILLGVFKLYWNTAGIWWKTLCNKEW